MAMLDDGEGSLILTVCGRQREFQIPTSLLAAASPDLLGLSGGSWRNVPVNWRGRSNVFGGSVDGMLPGR